VSKPKPTEKLHRFILRIPRSLWRKLVEMAYNENRSVNKQLCELIQNSPKEKP
jgi:predicted HicB family RNase H-like nuclease